MNITKLSPRIDQALQRLPQEISDKFKTLLKNNDIPTLMDELIVALITSEKDNDKKVLQWLIWKIAHCAPESIWRKTTKSLIALQEKHREVISPLLCSFIREKNDDNCSHLKKETHRLRSELLELVETSEPGEEEISDFIEKSVIDCYSFEKILEKLEEVNEFTNYYSFVEVLEKLQIEEEQFIKLFYQGEIRAFRDKDQMKFEKYDIDDLSKERMDEDGLLKVEKVSDEDMWLEGAIEESPPESPTRPGTTLDLGKDSLDEKRKEAKETFRRVTTVIDREQDIRADKREEQKVAEEIDLQEVKRLVRRSTVARKGRQPIEQPTYEPPDFEKALGEDAGRPGPVERLIAQSLWLMKSIQVTIGLKFIVVANATDRFLEAVSSYINGIFQAWKMSRSIQRRLQRHQPHKKIEGLIGDLDITRFQLSKLFTFPGYTGEFPNTKEWKSYDKPTFPLKLVIEIRGHLDEMKRDLNFLTSKQMSEAAKKSLSDFIKSFIPNPLELISQWKDVFILTFYMKYTREDIEVMYADMLFFYRTLINALIDFHQKELENDGIDITDFGRELAQHEKKLLRRLCKKDSVGFSQMEVCIALCRKSLQRLLQMLTNPGQFIYPANWSRLDLINEVKKFDDLQIHHPQYELELERWLTQQITRALKKNYKKTDIEELALRKYEARDFRKRYKLQRQLSSQFICPVKEI